MHHGHGSNNRFANDPDTVSTAFDALARLGRVLSAFPDFRAHSDFSPNIHNNTRSISFRIIHFSCFIPASSVSPESGEAKLEKLNCGVPTMPVSAKRRYCGLVTNRMSAFVCTAFLSEL